MRYSPDLRISFNAPWATRLIPGCSWRSWRRASFASCKSIASYDRLIDAGGTNADPDHQAYGARWWTLMTAPGYNWGYKTTPQEHLDGREIGYSRGKGLGGSTSINF